MVNLDKQYGTQETFFATCWSVLPENVQERYKNGMEGITRSLLTSIPEELLSLLTAKGKDHRPALFVANTVMALLYMKVTHISEEYFLDHIHSDAAMQYALKTENELHQPFSDNTFYRMRERLRNIYEESDRDLLQEITDMLDFAIEQEVIGDAPYNDLLDKVYRIDSLNISMHGRHMSRLELIYVINRMNINNIIALKGDVIPEELKHYCDERDHNKVIYFKGTLPELEAEAAKKGISIEQVEAEVEALIADAAKGNDTGNSKTSESSAEIETQSDANTDAEKAEVEALIDNTAKDNDADNSKTPEASAETDAPSDTNTENVTDNASQKDAGTEKTESKTDKGEFNRKKRCMLIARLRLADVVNEAIAIRNLVKDLEIEDSKELQLLDRIISEQTKEDGNGKIIPRENSEIKGSSLQSPYDDFVDGPTCRTKDGKTAQGWSANIVQRCGSGDYAVIVDRDLQPNIHSDQDYARDFYNKFGTDGFDPKTNHWNGICCDGLYCNSYELKKKASERGYKVFCGTITGIAPDPILAKFDIDMENLTVKSCPTGECILKAKYNSEKEEFRVRMAAGTCSACENCSKCGAKILQNNQGSILLKLKQYNEASTMHDLGDPTYRKMVNKRNAVEGVPSVLRRAYHIDQTTYFGKWYARYDLMLSTTAINMRVLLRYRQDKLKTEKKAA